MPVGLAVAVAERVGVAEAVGLMDVVWVAVGLALRVPVMLPVTDRLGLRVL